MNATTPRRRRRCGVAAAVMALIIGTNAWAQDPCRVLRDPAVRLMVCRGGQGSGFVPSPDADWVMPFRLASSDAPRTPRTLPSGTCAWEDGSPARSATPRVVFPYAGPLVSDAYPIGPSARTCAGEARCVMTFCARRAGTELQAIDGYIHLSFW